MDTYEKAKESWDDRYQDCLDWNALDYDIQFFCMGGVPAHTEKVWAKAYRPQCGNCQNPNCKFRA